MERAIYPNQTDLRAFKSRFYDNPSISESNRKAIREFIQKQEALGVGQKRVRKLLSSFSTVLGSIYPGLDLTTATEKELLELCARVKQSDYADRTKADFIIVIRRYYKVMEGRNAHYPEKLDYIKVNRKFKNAKGPDDLIKREQLAKLVAACINARDKAIISLLYEGGLRCGEILNLDIKDVRLSEDGVDIHVPDKEGCKTGARDLWLTECFSYMRDWIESHPLRGNHNAPFFVSLERHGRRETHTRYDAYSLRAMLKRCTHRSEIDLKKVHPHAFRHTCATEKAILGFSESQLNAFMGWKQGSEMAATYIHMSAKGVKDAYKRALGMPTTENGNESKPCPRCGYLNSFLADKCGRCSISLNAKNRLEMESDKDEALKFFNVLMTVNPGLKGMVEQTSSQYRNEIQKMMEVSKIMGGRVEQNPS